MAGKPKFDPSKPYEEVPDEQPSVPQRTKPKFDPSKPYEEAIEPGGVVDEPSEIGIIDRLMVKNFGGTPEQQVEYLRKSRPDLDIQVLDDEIVARKYTEPKFRKLDPGTLMPGAGFNAGLGSGGIVSKLKEGVSDIGDIGYDTLAGIASTAAGITGGLAGAPTVVGAPVAAAGAAGAAGTAMEGLRQALGQYFGTSKGADLGQMAIAGAGGAVAPLLVGTGATAKQVAKKVAEPGFANAILKKSLMGAIPEGAAPQVDDLAIAAQKLTESQKGLFSGFGDRALEFFSGGISRKAIKEATEEVPQELTQTLIGHGLGLDPTRKYTNQEIGLAIKGQGKVTNLGNAIIDSGVEPLLERGEMLKQAYETGARNSTKVHNVSEVVAPLQAFIDKYKNAKNPEGQAQARAAQELMNRFFKPVLPEGVHGPVPKELQMTTGEVLDLTNQMSAWIKDAQTPAALDSKGAIHKQMRSPMMDIRKTLRDKVYKDLDETTVPGLREAYREYKQFENIILPRIKDEQTAIKTFSNIDSPSNAVFREQLNKFSKKYPGTNILDLAKLTTVTKHFGDPSVEALSGVGTSTGRIMRAGDVVEGLAQGASEVLLPGSSSTAGKVMRGVSSLLTSPKTVGNLLRAQTAARRLGEKTGFNTVADFLAEQVGRTGMRPQTAVPMIWNAMQTRSDEK